MRSGETRDEAYCRVVLENLATCQDGHHAAAYRAAAALAPRMGEVEAVAAVVGTMAAAGYPEKEARPHARRGARAGIRNPRTAPSLDRVPRTPVPRPPAPPSRPERADVLGLWESAIPVTADPGCSAWLRERALDPQAVELWDLARALPSDSLPPWAGFSRQGAWADTGHRLLVPLYGSAGEHESFRARLIVASDTLPKVLTPQGFEVRGLVMACPLARTLLRGSPPSWWRAEVVVSEGVPDFLTWASRQPDAREHGPAYLGIDAGSWSESIAARIPDGAEVYVRTHEDEAGVRYADAVAHSLAERCRVYRPAGVAS